MPLAFAAPVLQWLVSSKLGHYLLIGALIAAAFGGWTAWSYHKGVVAEVTKEKAAAAAELKNETTKLEALQAVSTKQAAALEAKEKDYAVALDRLVEVGNKLHGPCLSPGSVDQLRAIAPR